MNYGVIYWRNSSHSIRIFQLQKKGKHNYHWVRPRDSYGDLLKMFMILPFQSQYIFLLLLFVVKCKLNSDIHSINTRQNSNFYQPLPNSTTYQKWTYYFGIKIFNNLLLTYKKCRTMLNSLYLP